MKLSFIVGASIVALALTAQGAFAKGQTLTTTITGNSDRTVASQDCTDKGGKATTDAKGNAVCVMPSTAPAEVTKRGTNDFRGSGRRVSNSEGDEGCPTDKVASATGGAGDGKSRIPQVGIYSSKTASNTHPCDRGKTGMKKAEHDPKATPAISF